MSDFVNNVNATMIEINSLSDDIYESLIEMDIENMVMSCDNLAKLLKDIKRSYK